MNEDTFNIEIRRVLKKLGITSQRQIEHAVEHAIAAGKLAGNETLAVRIQLDMPGVELSHVIEETIRLE
jgi:hypothetical protein